MKMYAENGVGDVLYTVMDGFEPEQTDDKSHPNYIAGGYDHTAKDWIEGSKFGYSCSAVKQADGSLNLFVSNSRNHTLNLTLDISDAFADYDIVEHSVITGKREEDIITSWDGYVKMLEGYDDSGVAVYSTQYAKDMVYTTETGISSKDRLTISPYSVNVIKLKNTQLTAGSAKFRGQHRLDISGCVKNATDNRDVTLFIENKDTHEIYHIAQTKLNGNNCYNFNFEFAQDIGDCNVIINYCGAVKNITDDFAEATDTSQMFEITGEITEQSVNAVVNNKFGFLDVNALMLAQGIADNGAFGGVRISDRQKLLPGENVFSAKVPENYGIYKLYFWENLINLTPIFKSITIN
jgi:hypothetical protein